MTESTMGASQCEDEPSRWSEPGPASGDLRPTLSRHKRDGLVRLAFRFVWNVQDAEDAVQEALQVAEVRHGQLREPTKWWSWLCKIVVQQCHTQRRATARRRRHLDRLRHEQTTSHEAGPDLSAESRAVRSMLPKLPRRQREVVVLRHLQGLDDARIAEILNIAPATVRVHAKAAREALCALLKERHPEWFDKSAQA